jgi:hypothetical protein
MLALPVSDNELVTATPKNNDRRMPNPDSKTVNSAYDDTLAELFTILCDAYAVNHAPDPAADKRFATALKLARQARDNAITIVSAP